MFQSDIRWWFEISHMASPEGTCISVFFLTKRWTNLVIAIQPASMEVLKQSGTTCFKMRFSMHSAMHPHQLTLRLDVAGDGQIENCSS